MAVSKDQMSVPHQDGLKVAWLAVLMGALSAASMGTKSAEMMAVTKAASTVGLTAASMAVHLAGLMAA